MINFGDVLEIVHLEGTDEEYAKNPFSRKRDGEWFEGHISISFLNERFGQYATADEMINATESEGLKLYFLWLKDEGILN